MKKTMSALCAVLMLAGLLTGCGSSDSGTEQAVELEAFWTEEEEKYQWGEDYFAELDGELLENYYPGLGEIPAKQLITKVPLMSGVVNEMVFAEGETEEDAGKIAEILQRRADEQAAGGAWYPESMEAWEKAQVIVQGRYVAMIASASYQEEIAADFNALFEA